jgi:predicted RNase H-like HicB family nuclease
MKYTIQIEPLSDNDGGGYMGTVPELPGCMSDGATPREALINTLDAIKVWLKVWEGKQ